MNHQSTDSPRSNDSTRCRHRTFEGRRCRLNASDPAIGLCNKHLAARDQRIEDADIVLSLTGELSCFSDPKRINVFLSRLLLLLAQGRISPRQAGVMAYTAACICALWKPSSATPSATPMPNRASSSTALAPNATNRRLRNLVAQSLGAVEGGIQRSGRASPHGKGNGTVGDYLLQDLQKPVASG